jgi:hypothetical protein
MKKEHFLEVLDGDAETIMTRAKLLKGKAFTKEVRTDIGVFTVRPLDNGEQAVSAGFPLKGVKAKGTPDDIDNPEMDVDIEQSVLNKWEQKFFILSCGLSTGKEERYTVRDVKTMGLPNEILNQLVEIIKDISGMGGEAEALLRKFLEVTERSGDTNANPNGEQVG